MTNGVSAFGIALVAGGFTLVGVVVSQSVTFIVEERRAKRSAEVRLEDKLEERRQAFIQLVARIVKDTQLALSNLSRIVTQEDRLEFLREAQRERAEIAERLLLDNTLLQILGSDHVVSAAQALTTLLGELDLLSTRGDMEKAARQQAIWDAGAEWRGLRDSLIHAAREQADVRT